MDRHDPAADTVSPLTGIFVAVLTYRWLLCLALDLSFACVEMGPCDMQCCA